MLLPNDSFKILIPFGHDGCIFSGIGTYHEKKVFFNFKGCDCPYSCDIPEITNYFCNNPQSIIENDNFKVFDIDDFHLSFDVEIDDKVEMDKQSIIKLIKNKIINAEYKLDQLFEEFDEIGINIIPKLNVLYELYYIFEEVNEINDINKFKKINFFGDSGFINVTEPIGVIEPKYYTKSEHDKIIKNIA